MKLTRASHHYLIGTLAMVSFSLSACTTVPPLGKIPQAYIDHVFLCTTGISASDEASIKVALSKAEDSSSVSAEAVAKADSAISSIITDANLSENVRLRMLDCVHKYQE